MTEFKRTTQAVDEIEALIPTVLDGSGNVERLGQMVAQTDTVVQKLHRKASETDPNKQTYGPAMREKVQALVSRWAPIAELARDVLGQRGVDINALAAAAATGGSPSNTPAWTGLHATTQPASQLWTPPAGLPAASSSAVRTPASPAAPAAAAPSPTSREDKRALALQAAEARARGAAGVSASASSAAPPAVQNNSTTGSSSAPMDIDSTGAAPAAPLALQLPPAVERMDVLMNAVHSVFLGHGFTRTEDGTSGGSLSVAGAGAICVRYSQGEGRPSVNVTYVPIQRHLMVYATVEGVQDGVLRAAVQLGMAAQAVQTKIDYLLVYPLVYRRCLPALHELPQEPFFICLSGLALPALAAVGCASRVLARSVFEDDVLWWQVLMCLPQSAQLQSAIDSSMKGVQQGQALPAGMCRQLARQEVQRLRREEEEKRRREEELRAARRRLEDPLMVRPPRMPPGFPGIGGIGGIDDVMPGGGFLPPGPFGGPGFGPRRGGGGGGFGPFGGGGLM